MVSMEQSDAVLLTRSTEGDRGAFEALVERHADALSRYAALTCRSAQDAERALRDGLKVAWRRAATVSRDLSARTWLLQSVVEACRHLAPPTPPSEPQECASAASVTSDEAVESSCTLADFSCAEAESRLSEYLDGDLSAVDCACLEDHLRRCADCGVLCEDLRLTVESLHEQLSDASRLGRAAKEQLRHALEDENEHLG